MAEGESFSTSELLNLNIFEGESLSGLFATNFTVTGPELEILEQPKQRGFRFRYSCEGPSHGGLPGENSAKGRKTYPSVQILNYSGKARIEVTLVTALDPPKPHAHSLVGKNVRESACIVEVGPECGMTATFPNLGIQHVTKKNVKAVLKERYLKRHQLEKSVPTDPSNDNGAQAMNVDVDVKHGANPEAMDKDLVEAVTREEMMKIDQVVEQEAKNMNLSTVRLCFQTYLPDDHGHFVICLKPVYSNPIFDSKAAQSSELKICRIDRQSGFVSGGEEVFLLCDKVQKDDIEVRFFEQKDNGDPWEAFGKFSTSDVHRQYAIVFKTPEYWDTTIERPVTVFIQLRRKSDSATSAPVEFIYKPTEFDPEQIGAKRRKRIPHFSDFDQPAPTGTGNDPRAGPSGADGAGASLPMLDPSLLSFLGGGFASTGSAPSFGFPGTGLGFSSAGPPAGGLGSFGFGTESLQAPFAQFPGSQEPGSNVP